MPEEADSSSDSKAKRIAIYCRKSNDENLTNNVTSIDSQKMCCRSYIDIQKAKHWEEYPEVFDDPAESGKSLKRPAMQRLLKCVQEKKIDGVIVYKLDRLTRNSRDFHYLLELFERQNVAFVSATESIDTKSPQGRLMTAIMVQFAQYDRELDQERSRDFHLSRARKGLWTGGLAPLGYDLKDKMLVINPEEAELVNRVFNLYVEYRSTIRVAQELNQLGFRRKVYKKIEGNKKAYGGKAFDMDSVLRILQRKVYIGTVRNTRTEQEFQGKHEPIVDMALFEQVQKLIVEHNHRGGEVHYNANKHGFLFKGLVGCGECGSAIVPTYRKKKGKTYLYYKCLAQSKGLPNKCAITPLGARKFESFVVENIAAIGWDRPFLEKITLLAQKKAKENVGPLEKEHQILEGRLKNIKRELRRLVDLVKVGSASGEVAEEIQRLEETKKGLIGRMSAIEVLTAHNKKVVYDVDAIQGTLQRFAMFINRLPVELQVKMIRVLVEKIIVFKDKIVIKVPETPVGEIQKLLDTKLLFGGCLLRERWGANNNHKQNDHRIGVVELDKEWRPQRDSNP